MEEDFIYWRHRTPIGIKIEEISGGYRYSDPKTRLSLARQIYCENGREGYRELEHFDSGAPYLNGEQTRISITHTDGLFVVATLPRTPEAELIHFQPRTAMGVDAERLDRKQVVRLRDKFLNADEKALIPADDVVGNITAWTAKEALFKAALTPGLDWREDYRILSLPTPMKVHKGADGKPQFEFTEGRAIIRREGKEVEMRLFCYDSEGCRVTLAYSPKCAKFGGAG